MTFQINQDPSKLATILDITLTNAGYFDDIVEIVDYKINQDGDSEDELYSWAEAVDSCLLFINEQLGTEYEPFVVKEVNEQLGE